METLTIHQDIKETINNSVIFHGKHNDRVYLMKMGDDDPDTIIDSIEALAHKKRYTKIFGKVPARKKNRFIRRGYRVEAQVPAFYRGQHDGAFIGKFLDTDRSEPDHPDRIQEVITVALEKTPESEIRLSGGYRWKVGDDTDANLIASVYRRVFATYPFPIFDPGYIRETMQSHIDYFCVYQGDELVAVSSAEKDMKGLNAEMTDFATLPAHRGKRLARFLLARMEDAMSDQGIHTAYTIARAVSFGMNITFARMGYAYGGTLINNTNISGNIESMNVWYKQK